LSRTTACRLQGWHAPRPKDKMRRVMRKAALLLIILLLAINSGAQSRKEREQDDPIRLQADLVTITAAVTDRGGRTIKSLKATDFEIFEDGVKQKITHFAATEEPFTVMLLLDISGSTRENISLMKRAARTFLDELRADDRVGVIVFSREIELIARLDDSRSRAESAIERAGLPGAENGFQFSSKTGTSFYDALQRAVEDRDFKQAEGRKAIVCMSDGVDSTSRGRYNDAALMVEKAEAAAYFLELNTLEPMIEGLVKDRKDPGYINFSQSQIDRYYDERDPNSLDRNIPRKLISPEACREIATGLYEIARRDLRQLASRTGGRVYPVSALTDLSAIYKQVADDLRAQYSISYYPSNEAHDGRWRAIRV
jgi:Ca-activated chloride channel family protein